MSFIVPLEQTQSVHWSDELFVSEKFEISNEEKAERISHICEIHGKTRDITLFSTPLTNFTPSRPPALGLKDESARDLIERLSDISFDLFPAEMDCSGDIEEVESSDGNIKEISFYSTPLINFTPSCPPVLGL